MDASCSCCSCRILSPRPGLCSGCGFSDPSEEPTYPYCPHGQYIEGRRH